MIVCVNCSGLTKFSFKPEDDGLVECTVCKYRQCLWCTLPHHPGVGCRWALSRQPDRKKLKGILVRCNVCWAVKTHHSYRNDYRCFDCNTLSCVECGKNHPEISPFHYFPFDSFGCDVIWFHKRIHRFLFYLMLTVLLPLLVICYPPYWVYTEMFVKKREGNVFPCYFKVKKKWSKRLMIAIMVPFFLLFSIFGVIFGVCILFPVGLIVMPFRLVYVLCCYWPGEFNKARYKKVGLSSTWATTQDESVENPNTTAR